MVLHRKVRKMIYDVYCFMKREADRNEVDNLKQCMKRTAAATKCSESTVRRIVKGAKDSEFLAVFRTPGKNKREKQKPITNIDSIDQGVLKRTIHNFHVTEKELPTIKKLRRKLQEDLNFQDDDSDSSDEDSSSDDDDNAMTASNIKTASSSEFHVTHDDLMQGVSPLL
ncbi:hypothetical protein ACJJTC_004589 [Scirpophaga incertulas]